ncbi:MAG: DUF4288 domain-containing protein, partial [Candidatus Omnitrophica bacterium]|nr:DUF4288 domain-containing protein [Candidatus Omnitrophota bacterium]
YYAVKTLYRSVCEGRPQRPDRYFDPDATLLEERIQLIKAKNRAEAKKKAEKDAVEYARRILYKNPYNQEVTLEYMGLCEIYEIEQGLADKAEIYASSRIISKKVSVAKVANIYLNPRQSPDRSKRRKFLNKEHFHD